MRLTSRSLRHLLRGLLLIGLALYIVYLVRTGNLTYYIAPRMAPYVKASALLFYAIAVQQFYFAIVGVWRKNRTDCDCGHIPAGFPLRSVLMYVLFALPLLLGSLLPDVMLGSAMADQKGMRLSAMSSNPSVSKSIRTEAEERVEEKLEVREDLQNEKDKTSTSSNTSEQEELDNLFPADAFTEIYAKYAKSVYHHDIITVDEISYTEILTTLDLYLDAFRGKTIELTGFVYRAEGMEENQFAVGRFAMSCCSADASPYGVFSEFANAAQLQDDEWITVQGKISKTHFNDNEIMMIEVTSVKKAQPPEEPYVYPNFDFGNDL